MSARRRSGRTPSRGEQAVSTATSRSSRKRSREETTPSASKKNDGEEDRDEDVLDIKRRNLGPSLEEAEATAHKPSFVQLTGDMWDELLKKTWQLYRCSALHGFDLTRFRFYERQLGKHLAGSIAANQIVGIGQQAIVTACTFRLLAELNAKEEVVLQSAVISVEIEAGQVVRQCAVVVHNIGQSITGATGDLTPCDGLLVRGPRALVAPVHAWLRGRFDCTMSLARVPRYELAALGASLPFFSVESSTKRPLEFVLALPSHIKGLDRISISIPDDTLARIRTAVDQTVSREQGEDATADELDQERTHLLFEAVTTHVKSLIPLSFDALTVLQVGTPSACVGATGKVKLLSRVHIQEVLGRLSQACH